TAPLLRCNFDGRVEVDLTRGPTGHHCPLSRTRRARAIGTHATEMQLDGPLNAPQRCVNRLAGCHTPREVRHRGPPVTTPILVDADEIPKLGHAYPRLNPAWRLTEAKVPLGMSSPRLPLTVTRPGLLGCLN